LPFYFRDSTEYVLLPMQPSQEQEMPAYMISYDLRKVRNYDSLVKQLKDWRCVRPLQSLWRGNLKGNAATIRDILRQLMDADDGLIVWGDPSIDR
jgi:hypothetical protein